LHSEQIIRNNDKEDETKQSETMKDGKMTYFLKQLATCVLELYLFESIEETIQLVLYLKEKRNWLSISLFIMIITYFINGTITTSSKLFYLKEVFFITGFLFLWGFNSAKEININEMHKETEKANHIRITGGKRIV
jgi:hypothetical protein